MRRTNAILGTLLITLGFLMTGTSTAWADKAPSGCNSREGISVTAGRAPATVTVPDTTTEQPLAVTIHISGRTFGVASAQSSVRLADARWCIKAGGSWQPGSGATGVSAVVDKRGDLLDISTVLILDVASVPDPWTEYIGVCLDGISGTGPEGQVVHVMDAQYVGPIGERDNGVVFPNSVDGSCGGTDIVRFTWVHALDEAAAASACASLGLYAGAASGTGYWPLAPTESWVCHS